MNYEDIRIKMECGLLNIEDALIYTLINLRKSPQNLPQADVYSLLYAGWRDYSVESPTDQDCYYDIWDKTSNSRRCDVKWNGTFFKHASKPIMIHNVSHWRRADSPTGI